MLFDEYEYHSESGFLNLHELVYTTKDYYRGVTAIEANWISELVPEWFSQKTG